MTGDVRTVRLHVVDAHETCQPLITQDVDDVDPDTVFDVPEGLYDAYLDAQRQLWVTSEAVIRYTEGARRRGENSHPLPAHTFQVRFGDPKFCWNPIRHNSHTHRYTLVSESRGLVEGTTFCDGDAAMAAHLLGLGT